MKGNLRLEGKSVILDEIRPEFFPYVIKWRNNKNLNRYINQPYELTPEKELEWYENIYLKDSSQGFMIMICKLNGTPFGTLGWTDYDAGKRQCINGRLILSDTSYAALLMEGYFVLTDYLYRFVDVMYAHVGIHNRKALQWNYMFGFELNSGEWEYPSEKLVNGVEQCEISRTKEKYLEVRERLLKQFNIEKPVEQPITESKTPPIILTADSRQPIFALIKGYTRIIRKNEPCSCLWAGIFLCLNPGRSVPHDNLPIRQRYSA